MNECLHAPWRIEYILGPKKPNSGESIFSKIARTNDDESNYVLTRGRSCYALLNSFPYTGGHILIVPYREVPDFTALVDDELLELMLLLRRCQAALTHVMRPDGFNIGVNIGKIAGAGIEEHLHIHLVPRWNGDTNFMPVLGATTILPQALQEIAAKLRLALADETK